MPGKLEGKHVAILATDGFEQAELLEPKKALEAEGAIVAIVSPKLGEIKGWNESDWGDTILADATVENALPDKFDALVLPGGAMNPDKLRLDPSAVSFAKEFFTAGKPVGAICHAAWTLIEADVVRGRNMTSWPSLQTDLRNAGANWSDQEVVVDANFVTSRKPSDLPAFNAKLIEAIGAGIDREQAKKSGVELF